MYDPDGRVSQEWLNGIYNMSRPGKTTYSQFSSNGIAVLEENNYYPFGLKHYGYNSTSGNPDYRYQYNGKELQDDTGMLDYGWRQYMPELGKWNGMDQLSESYFSYSPYAYVMNNPVMMYDPDGRVSQEWLNGIYNMSRPGKTTYSQFSSNGMSAWANYESLPFGEASRLYSLIDRGGSGYYRYWSGGDSDFTASLREGRLNFGGDFGILNQVRIYSNGAEIRQSYLSYGLGEGDAARMQNISWDAYKDWADWSATITEDGLKYMVKQRTSLYNEGFWIDNLGQRRSVAYAGRSRGSLIGLRSDYVRTTTKLGRYAKKAGMVGNVISVGEIGYGVYEDNWRFGKNAQVATAGVVGGMAGAASGAWVLGKAGGFIGTFVGPEGTVVGAAIGGVIGGEVLLEVFGEVI
ncbi:RHS repeat-associated core domain-containing protein [Chryseobacterium vaccae]|uniref:RHS repeat-associated core domain-containing protein n=1 Tax=Chryseobacterium vaccae TaxID=2604424 RepID=UPI0037431014